MKKLYEKSELTFAIVCIVIFSILQSLANPLNKIIGIESSANAFFNIILTVILVFFIKKNELFEKYGLCKTSIPARKFLWYLPLFLLASHNLWNGVTVNFPLADTVCYICYMLCVGFVEEVLFRGFLFNAIAIGFLFVTIYYRGGTLLPCIITHSAIDAVSAFANEAGLDVERRILFSMSQLIIVVVYTLILTKTLPEKQYSDFNKKISK